MRGALVAVFGLLLGGCAASLDFGRATTLPKGETRWSGGIEAQVLRADLRDDQSAPLPWVQLVTGAHTGVTDRLEVGGRAWMFGVPGWFTTFGLAADGKYQLHRSRFRGDPHLATGLSLSWQSPALGNTPWTVLSATVPFLVGFDVRKSQIVLGPRVALHVMGSYGQEPLVAPGAGAGFAWAIRARRVELTPQLTWMYTPVNWDGTRHDPARVGASSFTLGIGLSLLPRARPELTGG